MARPPKYNATIHAAIIDSLKLGCSRTTAAELAGIDRATIAAWADRYSAFSRDVDAAIASCKRTASATIRQAILQGDVQSAFRYLALQERHEWQERKHLDIAIEIRKKAERIADDLGMSVEDVIAEAEAIMAGAVAS